MKDIYIYIRIYKDIYIYIYIWVYFICRFILTVRDRITTTKSRNCSFQKSYKLICILMSEISI